MNHLKPVNRKAARIERATEQDVVALQRRGGGAAGLPQLPHFPVGCSLVFSPGWEADPPGSVSPWSATCSTATSAATGLPRFRTS
jgi:hypothetical protein